MLAMRGHMNVKFSVQLTKIKEICDQQIVHVEMENTATRFG
jgi:hypothetical protein